MFGVEGQLNGLTTVQTFAAVQPLASVTSTQ